MRNLFLTISSVPNDKIKMVTVDCQNYVTSFEISAVPANKGVTQVPEIPYEKFLGKNYNTGVPSLFVLEEFVLHPVKIFFSRGLVHFLKLSITSWVSFMTKATGYSQNLTR